MTGAEAMSAALAEWEGWSLLVAGAFDLPPGTIEHYRVVELLAAVARAPHGPANAIMAAALEERRAGPPPHMAFGDIREDAAFWADTATPAEVEAVVAAGLRRIERTQFAAAARKRLFVALWETMEADDRRAFLARVDPKGNFRGAA